MSERRISSSGIPRPTSKSKKNLTLNTEDSVHKRFMNGVVLSTPAVWQTVFLSVFVVISAASLYFVLGVPRDPVYSWTPVRQILMCKEKFTINLNFLNLAPPWPFRPETEFRLSPSQYKILHNFSNGNDLG